MKYTRSILLLIISLIVLYQNNLHAQQRDIDYFSKQWLPKVWSTEIPNSCPFKRSNDFAALAFLGKHVSYTDADTWYPSWASDGNMYSGFADGEIGLESTHSSGGAKTNTGNAKIEGDDPMHLKITSLGLQYASALPYQGHFSSSIRNG